MWLILRNLRREIILHHPGESNPMAHILKSAKPFQAAENQAMAVWEDLSLLSLALKIEEGRGQAPKNADGF